jgi:hypothetical protein
MRISSLLCSVVLVCCAVASAEPKHAASICGGCHQEQAISQPDTQMGRALQLPQDNTTLRAHPHLTFRHGTYSYVVETRDGKTTYTVSDGSSSISIPVLWAMGAQAQTWVLEHGGRMYESMVSYYPSTQALDITVGDDHIVPTTLEEAIGRPLDDQGVTTCFGCHASHAIVDHKLNLASFKPGVDCEHCHVGAGTHFAAAMQADFSNVPPSLAKMSSEDISDFCGQCHRTWELVVRAGWRGTANVRFQPYRLANSKCFDGADPRISCIACHDPHQKVSRNTAYYDGKCLACHSQAASLAPPHAKVCPVAKSNCSSCHMPKVPFPGGHFIFTDHDIRVVKAGEAYPN